MMATEQTEQAHNLYFEFDGHEVSLKKLKLLIEDNPILLAALDQMVAVAESDICHNRCPVHGRLPQITIAVSAHGELTLHTTTCCDGLARSTAEVLAASGLEHPTAYFTPGIRLMLLPDGAQTPFVFEGENIDQLLIGRSDSDTVAPALDLAPFGAVKNGVSRRHASIVWHRGALHVVDEGSANGTMINGEKLPPYLPHILRDGDALLLGKLGIRVMIMEQE